MKKQLRLITASRLAIDQWSKQNYPLPEIPKYVFGRHFRRHRIRYYKRNETFAIEICKGWYVLCFPYGRRMLSALPF